MGTRPIIYKYPLDLTGKNTNNLVLGEPHELSQGENRAVVPNYGAFFSESIVVRDADTGRVLKPREDFQAAQLYQEATQRTGLEVCAAIVVTDSNASKNIEVDYQAIGGEFSYSVVGLRKMLEDLDLDSRPVRWGDMLGKPSTFPPAPHLHDAGDLYGFEYLTEAIDALRHAIMTGQEAALGELRQYIELIEEDTRQQITDFFQDTTQKLNKFNNRLDVVEERTSESSLRQFFSKWVDEEYLRTHEHDPQAHRITKYDVGLSAIEDATPFSAKEGWEMFDGILENKIRKWLSDHEATVTQDHLTSASTLGLGGNRRRFSL